MQRSLTGGGGGAALFRVLGFRGLGFRANTGLT